MNISKAMKICHDNNVKVYPKGELININVYKFYIYRNDFKINKSITVRPKQKDGFKELNEAIEKTYIFYAKKLCNE